MADEKLVTREEKIQEQQRLAAREAAQAGDRQHDTTRPGGRYMVNGQWVNAEGEPVKDAGKD